MRPQWPGRLVERCKNRGMRRPTYVRFVTKF
jgi:hypothetical protein